MKSHVRVIQFFLFLMLSFSNSLFSHSKDTNQKGIFTHCVDAIEYVSERYINPVVYAFFGYKVVNCLFLQNTSNKIVATLNPNLTHENPLHQQACNAFNEVAQKTNSNATLNLLSECDIFQREAALAMTTHFLVNNHYLMDHLQKNKLNLKLLII